MTNDGGWIKIKIYLFVLYTIVCACVMYYIIYLTYILLYACFHVLLFNLKIIVKKMIFLTINIIRIWNNKCETD